MWNRNDASRQHAQLIIGLCLFVFFNISCFTVITSFTKSNFLTAIQTTPGFQEGCNQRPYFYLYGFAGLGFVAFYFLYHVLSPRVSFEYRIKRDILFLIGCSLLLFLIPCLFPGFQQLFFPASLYFVVYDILDDFIIVQTWTLINYAIDIRESRKTQNLFLFSGGVAAFISGRCVVPMIPADYPLGFLILAMGISSLSYLTVSYIYSVHRGRILTGVSRERVGFKALFTSQKKYRVIKSIIFITILVGIFNLFFKVLFDTEVNIHFPPLPAETAFLENFQGPDPKTEFIGDYKAYLSMFQVIFQLLFIYFFTRLWFNGRILFAYPLLLIPNMLFVLWAYGAKSLQYENLFFWGTIVACGVNELIRRIIFDAAYQVLMFSVPERLCNALRLYSRLLIKPLVVIVICAFFVALPPQQGAAVMYCFLIIAFLLIMTGVIWRIPGHYVSSLRHSVLRRLPLQGSESSLVSMEANYIIEQYEKAVADSSDPFGYLYILDIIGNNYAPGLNFIILNLLENEDQAVRREAVRVIGLRGVTELMPRLEDLFEKEDSETLRTACLKTLSKWGISRESVVTRWMDLELSIELRCYVLAIAYRTGNETLRQIAVQETVSFLDSPDTRMILAGIRLVGKLGLTDLKPKVFSHFNLDSTESIPVMLRALAKLNDDAGFMDYLNRVGYARISDFEKFNQNLAILKTRSFAIIDRMVGFVDQSRTHHEIVKCIRSLQFIPSQDGLDFLLKMFRKYHTRLIREEILNIMGKICSVVEGTEFQVLWRDLSREVNQSVQFARFYNVISAWKPDSLLLIELSRNIEHRIWCVFKILDIFHPDLAIFDSYYRITHGKGTASGSGKHVKGKSIEYLASLLKDEHTAFLRVLEAVIFEDGFILEIGHVPGPQLRVEQVYEEILAQGNHWLGVSAILDVPAGMQTRFARLSEEMKDMIPVLEKVHFLRKVPLFRGFSITDMIIMAQIAQEVSFEDGHVLFKYGDIGDALYLLLEGQVNIVNENNKLLVSVKPPDCFGEIAVLDKKGRSATAVCAEECRMLKIASNDFQEILEQYPSLYRNIVYILTSWLRIDRTRAKETRRPS